MSVSYLFAFVQLNIEPQHVDARLTEKSELSPLSELVYQRSDLRRIELARFRNARNLILRRSRADVRIESAARRRDEIGRHRRRVAGVRIA